MSQWGVGMADKPFIAHPQKTVLTGERAVGCGGKLRICAFGEHEVHLTAAVMLLCVEREARTAAAACLNGGMLGCVKVACFQGFSVF